MDLLERDEQLERLGAALGRAMQGRGRIVAIAGEAGAGKTTLVERFVADSCSAVRVHWGACEHLATPEPLLPLRDIARSGDVRLDPDADHVTWFETLLRVLADRPSVVVLEDVHWADAATLDLIRFLARRAARLPALVLITFRDEEAGARSPLRELLGEAPAGSVERMVLEPLSLAAVTGLAGRTGRSGAEIFSLTGGNPFLVTEALAVPGDTPPEAVRDATLARAAGLPDAARRLLEAVSIFPRSAEIALVADLVDGTMDEGLDACVEKAMLVLDGGALRFRHEIARRAIEVSLATTRRRALHQKVVEALRSSPRARASEIAHHAEGAGDLQTLMEFAERAGEYAARAGAHREAASHFATVLRYRDRLEEDRITDVLERHAEQAYLMGEPATAVASMLEAAERRRRAGDAIGLGRDLTRLTRFAWVCGLRADAERYLEEAIAVLGALPPGTELAWAYSHQAQLDMLASRNRSAIGWGERAIALAEQLGEREVVIHALGTVATARFEMASPGAAEDLERSLELARASGYHDHVERAFCNSTCSAYWRNDHQAALDQIERGVVYAAERDLTHWEAYLRGWRAMILLDQGDWGAAEREAEEMCGWTSAATVFRLPALIALARLRVRRGDPDTEAPLGKARQLAESLDELQRSVYVAIVDAERLWLANGAAVAADGAAATGSRAGVLSRLQQVHGLAVERDVQWAIRDTAFWLALIGATSGKSPVAATVPDFGDGRWRKAAEGWKALGLPYEEGVALAEGDAAAQRQALAIFDRLGAAPAAARLRRRMRAAGTRAVPRGPIAETRASPAGLTRRQTQVLSLLAAGLSNPEIADRLCISAKTAEHHVGAVMARLDATSRREAAATARRRGLLESPQT